MALNKACRDAVFISLPKAPHGNWNGFLTDASLREAATHTLDDCRRLQRGEPDALCANLEDRD